MRLSSGLFLLLSCTAARAEVTCEQFAAVAQQTVQQRDQGASLSRLLAEMERSDAKERLTPRELALMKDVIRQSFNGALSPAEVLEACRQGGALVPAR